MTGRKSEFTQDMADIICEKIVEGMSVRAISREPGMPSFVTIFKWLNQQPEFAKQYTYAKEVQAESFADEMVDIADFGEVEKEQNNRDRLRIDTRKWVASRLLPKKYGNLQHVELSGSVETTTKEQRDAAVAAATRADR